ncbi:MAG: histidine kinase, partial [Flavipsychrobacter sp.]|nr:histidine kinase [Flavipsychrobacter sp.]
MRILFLQILLLVCCFAVPVYAQQNDIFTSYGTDEGLPQSSIWNITQDKNGFLWMGTADGICRFDGYNFTVYRNNPTDSTTIVGGIYFRIYVDSIGNLWVISQNGISLYNYIKDNFQQVLVNQDLHVSANYNVVFGEDAQYIWVGILSYGLVKIDKRSHKAERINNEYYKGHIAQSASQTGLVANGRIWMAGNKSSTYVYNINTSTFDTVCTKPNFRIVNFNDSELLGATPDGLIIYNKNSLQHKSIPIELRKGQQINITDVLVASPSLVILSSAIGLSYIDTRTWKLQRQVVSFEQGKKRSYSFIQCIYKDRSGNLWQGTNGDGLKKLTNPYKYFKLYTTYSDDGNLVKAIYADSKNLYSGYFANGFDIFDRKDGWKKKVIFSRPLQGTNSVYAISAVDSNNLVVQSNGEISLYTLSSGQRRTLAPALEKLFPNAEHITNVYPFLLKTGSIIYANYNDCLVSFDISSWPNVKPAIVHQFKDERLSCIFKDNKDGIWIGTTYGVYCIEKKVVRKVLLPEAELIKTISQDGAGNMWIGTIKGIYVLDANNKVLQHYTENNGLSNRFVYGILRGNDNNMWFSHNKGISVYKTASQSFRHYTREDGLQSNEFNTGAYFKAADGELFFGGINGFNSFYPEEILDNKNIPAVLITSIKLFDIPLKTDSASWNIHTLTLPYTDNSLSFEFAALEYTNSAKNQYAYMMEGVDKKWITEGNKRFARYAALQPGKYIFKVKAANNDGVWQNEPTTIVIEIVPPYWQQLWFRILMLLLLIAGITGIVLLVQRQQNKRRIHALEMKQKIQFERERISRDLHDTVGTQLSLISNNIEWVTHPLKEITDIEKSEKLQFVNNAARDIIATLRETIWALNKQQIQLEEFADKLKGFIQKQLAIYPEIELVFDEQIGTNIILGPSEALDLFRICQEAIANSLKYAQARLLEITIQNAGDKYTITIADDGKGFDMNTLDPSVHNGIENMRYRARDINSNLEIHTEAG